MPLACRVVGPELVLRALLERLDARDSPDLSTADSGWLRAALSPPTVAKLLSEGRVQRTATLAAFTSQLGPDDLPNDFGEDPWFFALKHVAGAIPEQFQLLLKTWTLARALGHRSRNQADLFQFGMEEVYVAVLDSRLSNDCWQLLDSRLPDANFWAAWDRGRRLRVGVASAFIDRDLNPFTFGGLVQRDDVFEQLASEASSTFWGRSYLKRVKRALKDADGLRFSRRIGILKRLL